MPRITRADFLGYSYFSCHGPELTCALRNGLPGTQNTINIFSETGLPAKPNNAYFDQLVCSSAQDLKQGRLVYVFQIEQITAIQKRLPGTILNVKKIDEDIYCLRAERERKK